jgi:hypothetical protein
MFIFAGIVAVFVWLVIEIKKAPTIEEWENDDREEKTN